MSSKKPIKIKINKIITIKPEEIFESEIVKNGNGAVAKAYKKHIGKKCLIIVKNINE